jgi:hypothetical protein
MAKPFHIVKLAATGAAAAVRSGGPPSLSYAHTGSVHIHIGKAGFIVGLGGGSSTLNFKGRHYPLRISGMSFGTIGVARADMVGRAYNLRSATDIIGTYSAAAGSIAGAGGVKAARLQSASGVVLDLRGRQLSTRTEEASDLWSLRLPKVRSAGRQTAR